MKGLLLGSLGAVLWLCSPTGSVRLQALGAITSQDI